MRAREGGRLSRAEWGLVALLIVSIFINYVDRGNLSVAAPLLGKELALSPVQIGTLLSAFFWTYSLLQLVGIAGWLADVLSIQLVFASGVLVWSAATVATGFCSTFGAIYVARLVLGAGESVAYPCYSRIFASELPQHHRGRANALLDASSKLGPAAGSFLAALWLARLGWRLFFIALGIGSLLWLLPWFRWGSRFQSVRERRTGKLPPFHQLLRNRSAWGTFGGHFCGNYFWFFLLTWLPTYLVNERNLSIRQMGWITAVAFALVALSAISAGWVSDHYIAQGVSPTRVRKTIVVSGLTFSSAILPVAFVSSSTACITFLMASCIAFGAYTSNHWAITQTLAGPLMAGRWTSLQNGMGNLSGILAPTIAGGAVQMTGSSKIAFFVSAVIVIAGALFWGFVVGPVEPVFGREASAEGVVRR